jgi:hypothetical protein
MPNGNWIPRCILCKQSVNIGQSKADEYGRPVHEQCYVSLLVPKKPPEREKLSLMTMIMSAGWN